ISQEERRLMHPRQDPSRRCLLLQEWPERDRATWYAACRSGNPLEESGALSRLRSHTLAKLVKGYGRWLTWLFLAGLLDPDLAPDERVTRERVTRYVDHLKTVNAPYTVLARVQELFQAMKAMVPQQDWTWIRRIEKRLRHTVAPACIKAQRL